MTRFARIALVPAVIGIAACTGSLFQSKTAPPALYMLSEPPADVPGAEIPVELAILRPKLRTGLETDRIAVLYADRRLDYFAGARWSGPLGDVLQDLAVQAFRSHVHLRNVGADASVFASPYWLEIEVTDFQAEYTAAAAPTVHVHFVARLGTSGDRHILGQFEANVRRPAAQNRLTAIVDAYAYAAEAALAEIVTHAGETLAPIAKAR